MHRDVENGCDVIFPDIDGDSFDDVREHWKPGSIVQMSIPMLFNMRNEIFSSDLDVSFKALQGLDGIEIVRDVDQILVTLIDQEFSGPSAG